MSISFAGFTQKNPAKDFHFSTYPTLHLGNPTTKLCVGGQQGPAENQKGLSSHIWAPSPAGFLIVTQWDVQELLGLSSGSFFCLLCGHELASHLRSLSLWPSLVKKELR